MLLLFLFIACAAGPAPSGSPSAAGAARVGEIALLASEAERLAAELEASCDLEVGGVPDEAELAQMRQTLILLEGLSVEISDKLLEVERQAREDAQRAR